MKTELENGLKRRFKLEDNKIFTLATLLDPRYKLQFFEAENVHKVKSQFLLEALKNSSNERNDSEKVNADNDSLNSSISQSEVRVHRNFWECYQEMVSKKVEGDEKSSSAYELEAYLSLIHI